MFVMQERLRVKPKSTFYYKKLPKVLNLRGYRLNRKAVSPILDCSCNPKGSFAYKYIFDMQEEKQFVADSQLAKTTPLHVVDHHAQNFYNTIKNFYSFANPSDFIEANNDLLNTFLQKGLDEEEGFTPKHLQNIVFMVNLQNQFLTALKEDWESLTKSINH